MKFNNEAEIIAAIKEMSLSKNTVMPRTGAMINNLERFGKKILMDASSYPYNLTNQRMSLIPHCYVYLFDCVSKICLL